MVVKNKQLTDRAIYVYLPTVEMSKEWKTLADKARISISKFVIEHVENSLKQEDEKEKGYASRAELQLKEKDEQIAKLTKDNRRLETLADKLDNDLRHYRAQPFLSEDQHFQGTRRFDKDLVQLLRTSKNVDSDQLLKQLGIDPRETDLVKAVNRKLQVLQAYGLVEPTTRGWRWVSE
jgi:hypothetical protein